MQGVHSWGRYGVWGGVLLAVASGSADARAYCATNRCSSIFPERWLQCKAQPVRPVPAPPPRPADPLALALVPVPQRRGRPQILPIVPDVADEVVMVEPVPTLPGLAPRPAVPPAPTTVVVAGGLDWRCLGALRGTPGIVRVLSAPPGTRFYGHHHWQSWIEDNMVAASAFGLKAAIKPLRATLARPLPSQNEWKYRDLRASAAVALGALGDRRSAPKMVEWLKALEAHGPYGRLWSDTLHSLALLDAGRAETYAIGLLRRLDQQGFSHRRDADALEALQHLTARRRGEVLPVLGRLTASPSDRLSDTESHRHCELMAARLRLNDEPLTGETRRSLGTDLRSHWLVFCYSDWIDAAFGRDPDGADTLVYRQQYELILQLLAHMNGREAALRSSSASGSQAELARIATARRKLLSGLRPLSTSAKVSKPRLRDYSPRTRVRHFAALAALGDGAALRILYQHADDPKDESDVPWMAATFALRLGLRDAMAHAVARMRRGLAVDRSTSPYGRIEVVSPGVTLTWRIRLLEEVLRHAPAGDSTWTIGLLDADRYTREQTLLHLSQRRPVGACEQVAQAAPGAKKDAVEDGFFALSVMGEACRPTMARLARDSSQPSAVRGMAIELLAMLRDPAVPRLVGQIQGQRELSRYAKRAQVIFASPE